MADVSTSTQMVILLVCTLAGPSSSLQAGQEAWPAQPEGLLSGLGRLVERVALDFGAHAAHFLLNGLPSEHLAIGEPAGGDLLLYIILLALSPICWEPDNVLGLKHWVFQVLQETTMEGPRTGCHLHVWQPDLHSWADMLASLSCTGHCSHTDT